MKFKLKAPYKPTGDQPKAILRLVDGFNRDLNNQVLLGVTGSGKTFTMAHLIQKLQLPTLIISHNKTLTAQLYQEFSNYFPHNAVAYFVSYYDYYQPEAYMPQTDTYISKEANINEEIDKLRLQATSHLFSRRDVIVTASVSCIYNIGSPEQYRKRIIELKKGELVNPKQLQKRLMEMYYQRSRLDLDRGQFRVRGDNLEINLPFMEQLVRIGWNEDQKITSLSLYNPFEDEKTQLDQFFVFPAKHYLADEQTVEQGMAQIRTDLATQLKKLKKEGKDLDANRLAQKVNYDLEMITEVGYVNGIENYSRYFDGRTSGEAPYTLVDYFKHRFGDDFLVIIDESHMTVPQIRGMYHGDLARKKTLIDFGFRLPSCLDNRPFKANEFWQRANRALFSSATPNDWEIQRSKGRIVEQLVRPTGLVDPQVEIRPTEHQIKDLIKEILKRKHLKQRVLVTTLTKRMAEDLSSYLAETENTVEPINVQYLHADIGTMERGDILADLRRGKFDVVVGINLLREGLDLPEVSLVAILDADKQGFLRSKTALIQTMGRASRHVSGQVILYADQKTVAMREAIKETQRRRASQLKYNQRNGITPESITKPIRERIIPKREEEQLTTQTEGLTPGDAKKLVVKLERQMRQYAKVLEFEKAVGIRDEIKRIKKEFDLKK
ncbi:excinuclease ABC subunit UvrB [Patescibacteria group bacterium]|nr:excinuclease ABC subunit UvrB [Patescibacteria group bacterium]